MKIQITNFDINFSDERIKNFLINKGYTLEEHTLDTYFGSTPGSTKLLLALYGKQDEKITEDKYYEAVFKRELKQNIEKMLLAI